MTHLMVWGTLSLLALHAYPARAHSGPPFPLVQDYVLQQYKVSIWADPDIGNGTFYVVLEPPANAPLVLPSKIEIALKPVARQLAEKRYVLERQPNQNTASYFVAVPFDRQEKWRVRVLVHGAGRAGEGAKVDEIVSQVEATPDDLGPLGMLVYAMPFVALAVLWGRAALKNRQMTGPTGAAQHRRPPRSAV